MGDNDRHDSRFEDSRIDRRQFVRLSAATAGALALPGAATAQVESAAMRDTYQFAVNHTPTGERVPTLATCRDEAGVEAFAEVAPDPVTTTSPTAAAYARLTADQAERAAALDGVSELAFSPGANPFWKLEDYADGVFPSAGESVGFIDYEEMIQGMERLQEQNPDRLRFRSIARTPATTIWSPTERSQRASGSRR